MSFPDYPDYLITDDPRSPYYDGTELDEMSDEELEETRIQIEMALDERPRNYMTEKSYRKLAEIKQRLNRGYLCA